MEDNKKPNTDETKIVFKAMAQLGPLWGVPMSQAQLKKNMDEKSLGSLKALPSDDPNREYITKNDEMIQWLESTNNYSNPTTGYTFTKLKAKRKSRIGQTFFNNSRNIAIAVSISTLGAIGSLKYINQSSSSNNFWKLMGTAMATVTTAAASVAINNKLARLSKKDEPKQ